VAATPIAARGGLTKVNRVLVDQVEAKSILQKSGIPSVSHVINPYVGCVHGCVYCYARFMKRFTNHSEPWGAFLDAKINGPQLLRRQLERRRTPLEGTVLLSSVTDPYLPAERKYRLTRRILEVLLDFQVSVAILTKSDLVLRDLDLLIQFDDCRVGLSVSTPDDEISRLFERTVAPPSRRIRALRRLRENGVPNWVFASPYLPEFSAIDPLLASLDGAVEEFAIEALNTRQACWSGVAQVVARHFPGVYPGYKQLVCDPSYWDALEAHAAELAAERGILFRGLFRH